MNREKRSRTLARSHWLGLTKSEDRSEGGDAFLCQRCGVLEREHAVIATEEAQWQTSHYPRMVAVSIA